MQNVEVKRLAFIRYLYKVGVEQSNQPEPINATSLLSFHDAAELFLQLAVEHLSATKNDMAFMKYWDVINEKLNSEQLTQKTSMERLNKARVQLKHHGTSPSKLDVEAFRATATNFFRENTVKIFGMEFDSISLIDLVVYDNTRSRLKSAQNLIQNGDANSAIGEISASFAVLIYDYEQKALGESYRSPFDFGPSLDFQTSFFMGEEGEMGDFIDKVNESINSMQKAIKIIGFGFDYRKYSKFQSLTPYVRILGGNNKVGVSKRGRQATLEDCEFCMDFVIECAIKLQDFDYNAYTTRAVHHATDK